jgi:hypothetical protein
MIKHGGNMAVQMAALLPQHFRPATELGVVSSISPFGTKRSFIILLYIVVSQNTYPYDTRHTHSERPEATRRFSGGRTWVAAGADTVIRQGIRDQNTEYIQITK